jgi:DNA-binding transcriptional ArsR family regulator
MPTDEIRMDKKVFEALASDTRITILKELDQRQRTVTELANSLGMAKATVHEHLAKMVEVDLIEKEDSKRKWTYYRLTRKGRSILHPHEMTKFLVLLGSSILAFLGGASQVLKSLWVPAEEAMMQKAPPSTLSEEQLPVPRPVPPEGGEEVLREAGAAYAKEPLILGVLLIVAALLLGYYAYRIWRKSRPKKLGVKG